MSTNGAVRSRKSNARKFQDRMLPNDPQPSSIDPSRIASPCSNFSSDTVSLEDKPKDSSAKMGRRWISMGTLLTAVSTLAIVQIGKSANSNNGTLEASFVRTRQASTHVTNEVEISSSFDPKPISLVLDDDGSVETIRLSWFKIEEEKPKEYDPKSVNYRTNLMGFQHSSRVNGENCVAMYDWQETFKPTCNNVHELDMESAPLQGDARMVDNGFWRDVWEYKENVAGKKTSWALKTLRIDHEVDRGFLNEQARDATISEQLTFSPNVANIYNYCGLTSMYDFAHNGTLSQHWKQFGSEERLRAAASISRGLADAHTLGGGKYSPLAHTDIAVRQFVNIDGNFLLNDFNTAGLLLWDEKNKKPCKWSMYRPHDSNRAPEEHFEYKNPADEKMDVYSLGNIFYKFLTGERKYDDIKTDEAAKLIMAGDIPALPEKIEKSKDPVYVALKHVYRRALVLDTKKRASAKEIADYLEEALQKYEKERKKEGEDSKGKKK